MKSDWVAGGGGLWSMEEEEDFSGEGWANPISILNSQKPQLYRPQSSNASR